MTIYLLLFFSAFDYILNNSKMPVIKLFVFFCGFNPTHERLPKKWNERRGFIEYLPRLPDRTPLGFFLWGYLKDKLYTTKPATVANLREAMEHECAQIPRELFHNVSDFVAWRCQQ